MTPLPQPVADVVDVLAAMPGAVAVVLGGSRAARSSDNESDWDLGLYYRREIDLTARAALVCNEKRLIESAGLENVNALFAEIPTEREPLSEWVELVAERLGVKGSPAMPWKRGKS